MFLPLLLAAATASPIGPAATSVRRVALSEVGFEPAGPERPAMGPELYAAGPDGAAGLYDPVRREVLLLGDGAPHRFPMPRLDDLAFTGAGDLLVLDEAARTLALLSPDGAPLDALDLPGLVPPGCRLLVDGDTLRAVDVFGNRHRLARLTDEGRLLADGDGPALVQDPHPLTWDAERRVLSWAGGELALPGALKAGARWLDGPGGGWLLVDAVVADSPLQVERTAVRADTGLAVPVPVGHGAWAPGRAAAVGPDGGLLLLLPGQDALKIERITP